MSRQGNNATTKQIELWKLNKQTLTIISLVNCQTNLKTQASAWALAKQMSFQTTFMESLILAQDERWRRA